MSIPDLGHYWTWASLFEEIVMVVVAVFGAIRRDPKDRVLWFESMAFVALFLGPFMLRLTGNSWQGSITWLALFFGFTFLAAYFAIANWLNRRKAEKQKGVVDQDMKEMSELNLRPPKGLG